MTENITHAQMVETLAKPGEEIAEEMTQQKWAALHTVVGEAINTSHRVDAFKKVYAYNVPMAHLGGLRRDMPNLTGEQADLVHMALGIFGEAGELLEAVANYILRGKPLDMSNAREELGDLEFYLEGIRQNLGLQRDELLEANMAKLSERYEGFNYSDTAAIERADKVTTDVEGTATPEAETPSE